MIGPELFSALIEAYKEELVENWHSYSSEHDGVLSLGIDKREDIKCEHVKPSLEGYDDFIFAIDNCTMENETKFIEPFEARAEDAMRAAEQEIVKHIVRVI